MSTPQEQVHFGLKWVSASLAVSQGVRFVTTIVLARLLVPELFGLVGMAQVAIALLGVIRQLGFGAAYVQRPDSGPEDERAAADTTFWLGLAVNGLLFGVAFAAAPAVAGFFQSPEVLPVLRAMFVLFLLDAVDMTPSLVLQRRLEFGKQAVAEIGFSVAGGLIAIPLAAAGFGVWSLVGGQLGSRFVRAALLFRLSRWRPGLAFSRRIARELFSFGKYLWAFAGLSAVGDNLDRLLIGRWLGAGTLGVYELAFNLANLPTTHLSRLINQIAFPSFSRIQHDRAALRRGFLKSMSLVALLASAVAFGLLAVADEAVRALYGERWAAAVPVLRILAFYGLFLSISSTAGPVLLAVGRPNLLFYTSVVHHGTLAVLLLTLGRFGVLGIATAVLIPMALSAAVAFVLVVRLLEMRWAEVLSPVVRALASGAAMYAVTRLAADAALRAFAPPPLLLLLLAMAVGAAAYLALAALVNRAVLAEMIRTVRATLAARGELV